jgi:hypothetical protein
MRASREDMRLHLEDMRLHLEDGACQRFCAARYALICALSPKRTCS